MFVHYWKYYVCSFFILICLLFCTFYIFTFFLVSYTFNSVIYFLLSYTVTLFSSYLLLVKLQFNNFQIFPRFLNFLLVFFFSISNLKSFSLQSFYFNPPVYLRYFNSFILSFYSLSYSFIYMSSIFSSIHFSLLSKSSKSIFLRKLSSFLFKNKNLPFTLLTPIFLALLIPRHIKFSCILYETFLLSFFFLPTLSSFFDFSHFSPPFIPYFHKFRSFFLHSLQIKLFLSYSHFFLHVIYPFSLLKKDNLKTTTARNFEF